MSDLGHNVRDVYVSYQVNIFLCHASSIDRSYMCINELYHAVYTLDMSLSELFLSRLGLVHLGIVLY